jgi:hypothetical protein
MDAFNCWPRSAPPKRVAPKSRLELPRVRLFGFAGRWGHAEMSRQVRLDRRVSMNAFVRVYEGQILALQAVNGAVRDAATLFAGELTLAPGTMSRVVENIHAIVPL